MSLYFPQQSWAEIFFERCDERSVRTDRSMVSGGLIGLSKVDLRKKALLRELRIEAWGCELQACHLNPQFVRLPLQPPFLSALPFNLYSRIFEHSGCLPLMGWSLDGCWERTEADGSHLCMFFSSRCPNCFGSI